MPDLHDITPEDQHVVLQHMAKVHPDNIYKGLGHLIRNGILSHEQAIGVVEKIGKAQKDNEAAALKKPKEEKPISTPTDIKTSNNPEKPISATPSAVSSKQDDPNKIIKPEKDLRAWELGKLDGTPQTSKAEAHMKNVVRQGGTIPSPGGETFNAFKDRILPVIKKSLENDSDHTTIVTHSSVLKAFKIWDDLGRPDKMTKEQSKKFAEEYNDEQTHNGEIEDFKGKNGTIHVIRHGQTEDNKDKNFRSPNDDLTDLGRKQAAKTGDQLKAKLKGQQVPNIISSSLPRAVETAQIINSRLQPNPILSPSTKVEMSDKENPHESARIYQGSYDRLLKGGEDPNDPDMKRMQSDIEKLKTKGTKEVLKEKIKQDPQGLIDDLHNMGIVTKK